MKSVFKDWRNSALAIAVVALVGLGVWHVRSTQGGDNSPVVRVGERVVTQQQVIDEMKQRYGDEIVSSMISKDLLEQYAAKQGVTVSDQEVQQIIDMTKVQVELQHQTLDDFLAQRNMTKDEMRDQARLQALQLKLVVPEDAVVKKAQELAKGKPIFQARWYVRQFFFPDKETGAKAYDLIKNGDKESIQQAASMSLMGANSAKVQFYGPDYPNQQHIPSLDKLLKTLKPGECTKLMPVPGSPNVYQVLQLVEYDPAQKADAKTNGLIIRMQMMGEQQYQIAGSRLFADALAALDVQFKTTDYPGAQSSIKDVREKNPRIPGASEGSPVPGASPVPGSPVVPGVPEKPAAPTRGR